MSQLITKTDKEMTLYDWLESPLYHSQLQVAAPRGVQAARFARVAESIIKGDPKLVQCEMRSVLNAVMVCVQTGLEPGPLGHAAIVPYRGKAQWQAMYRGLLHLVHRSEQIASVQAGVVREKDHFDFDEGSRPFVEWKKPLLSEEDRGERIGVFATLIPKVGLPYVQVMPIADIEKIRKQYDKGQREDRPWMSAYDEMAKKTVIKRLCKLAPISVETATAVSYDDLNEVGKETPDALGPQFDEDRSPDSYCNSDLGEGLVCSQDKGHAGDCG